MALVLDDREADMAMGATNIAPIREEVGVISFVRSVLNRSDDDDRSSLKTYGQHTK